MWRKVNEVKGRESFMRVVILYRLNGGNFFEKMTFEKYLGEMRGELCRWSRLYI